MPETANHTAGTIFGQEARLLFAVSSLSTNDLGRTLQFTRPSSKDGWRMFERPPRHGVPQASRRTVYSAGSDPRGDGGAFPA